MSLGLSRIPGVARGTFRDLAVVVDSLRRLTRDDLANVIVLSVRALTDALAEASKPCPVCAKRLAHQRAKRQRWRSVGACPKCGSPHRGRYTLCKHCRELDSTNKRVCRARRRQREEQGAA